MVSTRTALMEAGTILPGTDIPGGPPTTGITIGIETIAGINTTGKDLFAGITANEIAITEGTAA